MNQAHSQSSPDHATSLPANVRSSPLKAVSNLAIQLRAVDNSIATSILHTPAGSPQGKSSRFSFAEHTANIAEHTDNIANSQ